MRTFVWRPFLAANSSGEADDGEASRTSIAKGSRHRRSPAGRGREVADQRLLVDSHFGKHRLRRRSSRFEHQNKRDPQLLWRIDYGWNSDALERDHLVDSDFLLR